MAPGEVGDESIIANGVGQAPDAFVWAVLFAMRVCRAGLACDQRLVRLRQLKWGRAKSDFQGSLAAGWFLRKIVRGFLGNILAAHLTFPSAIHQPFGMLTPVVFRDEAIPAYGKKFARRAGCRSCQWISARASGNRHRPCPCTNRRPCARPCNPSRRLQFARGNSGAPANESIDPDECGVCQTPLRGQC